MVNILFRVTVYKHQFLPFLTCIWLDENTVVAAVSTVYLRQLIYESSGIFIYQEYIVFRDITIAQLGFHIMAKALTL